jgi:hypothetical protein
MPHGKEKAGAPAAPAGKAAAKRIAGRALPGATRASEEIRGSVSRWYRVSRRGPWRSVVSALGPGG